MSDVVVKRVKFSIPTVILSGCLFFSCSTNEIVPIRPPTPPMYTQVNHPRGLEIGDLSAALLSEDAPKDPMFYRDCDSAFKKLKTLTSSLDEIKNGVRELIRNDPVRYHWCFYGKLMSLENFLKGDAFLDVKQKEALETYEFLVPVAKSFASDFHDTRYVRWAVARYERMSEWLFFRKLTLSPEGTVELVTPANPFGLYRKPLEAGSVLEKYHLQDVKPMTPTGPPAPAAEDDREVPAGPM